MLIKENGGPEAWRTLKHILIVDDEEAVCWALQRALAREGHSVSVAASAEQAFTLIEQKRPDAIILDVRLPGMDGLTALARLRLSAPAVASTPLTAEGKEIGWLTTVAVSPRHGPIALGYVHRSHFAPGSALDAAMPPSVAPDR